MNAVVRELCYVLAAGVVLALAGLVVGDPRAFVTAGGAAYLCWQLYYVIRLERWLRDRKRWPLPDGRGIWRDIFDRLYRIRRQNRRRKKKLVAIIDRFQQASEAMPDGAVIFRASGEIEWLNPAAKSLLGLRYPQDVGRPLANLVRHPSFRDYLAAGRFDEALELPAPANEMIRLSVRVVPYGEDRRLMIARDMTRLHRLERMRQDFAANLTHELRSPLTVIKGYVETMADPDAGCPAEWQRPLQHLTQQTDRMCHLVDDLMQLSRLESSPGDRKRVPVRVADMLERIRSDALGLGGAPRVIRLQADAALRVFGDHNELRSAFSNLVFNAVQHTPPESEISVRWYADEDGAHFEVADTGPGIEAHHIPRLAERFYRVDEGRARESGGSGLGLAIVKHVLKRHDAVLRVESEPGTGSVFVCDFPRRRIAGPAVSAASA